MPRWLTTTIILVAAALLTWAMFQTNTDTPPIPEDPDPTVQPVDPGDPDTPDAPDPPDAPDTPDPDPPVTPDPPVVPEPTTPSDAIEGLRVVAASENQPEPTIGGTARDEAENPYVFEARFSPWGASVRHLKLARYSSKVDEHDPLVLQEVQTVVEDGREKGVYPMAVQAVTINGTTLTLWNHRWTAGEIVKAEDGSSSVTFTIDIAGADDKPVLRIERTWRAAPGRYDLHVNHKLTNLSDDPLDVSLQQLGPVDLTGPGGQGGGGFMDQRHITVATLRPIEHGDGAGKRVSTDGYRLPRARVIDDITNDIYPGAKYEPDYQLLWAAMDNRYFTIVTHGVVDPERIAVRPIDGEIAAVSRVVWGPPAADPEYKTLGFTLDGTTRRIEPGSARTVTFDIYAGPKDPAILKEKPEYVELKMGDMVVYNLGGMCAFCTFDWLALGLLNFLGFMHSVFGDWGLAIIGLVAVIRTILHPLTKRSQINMMKVSKQMQQLQPEMQKIKEKYADDKEKLNAETMKLYRERGVNPAAMGLGCLPMFLQMPIWVALYAMLYFAIELRHEPAFYGLFQAISGDAWLFLADLSAQDRFIPLPESVHFNMPLLGWRLEAINILPLLMGLVFYLQQKYTTAATPPTSEQAAQQQKMMKWMTMLFPIFLYAAPSGLTLYILTSTTVGVIESRRVRAHLKELEDSGKLYEKKPPKPGGFMDRLSKAVEAKQKEMAAKQGGGGQSAGPKLPTDTKKKQRRGKGGRKF